MEKRIEKFVDYIRDYLRRQDANSTNKGKINRLLKNEFGSQAVRSRDPQKVVNVLKKDGILTHDSDSFGSYDYYVHLSEQNGLRQIVREELKNILSEQGRGHLPSQAQQHIKDAQYNLDQAKGELLGTDFEDSQIYDDLAKADRILKSYIDQMR